MRTIFIVGAGFSGVVTAANLLRSRFRYPVRIVLLNRNGSMARGLAYGTHSPFHTLNVPCGNMSALADQPEHFLEFVRKADHTCEAGSFVSRALYGEYLEALLANAEHSAMPTVTLERMVGEAARIEVSARGGGNVVLADGCRHGFDDLVLAFGHFPSANPNVANPEFYASDRYIRDPWEEPRVMRIAPEARVLLLGTGLTAVDIAMTLLERNPHRVISAVSRRGLLPRSHRQPARPPRPDPRLVAMLQEARTVRKQVRAFRMHVERSGEAGDWRDALGALRPHTTSMWQALPEAERRRFMRHVQPFWDCHRHRLAPAVHDVLDGALLNGSVQVRAARLVDFNEGPDGVLVSLQARGQAETGIIHAHHVINCTGPASNLKLVDSPLIQQLLANGMITPDRLGLGLHVSQDCAVIDANGRASSSIHYIGPLLKADYWEATAVPELRRFAQSLAAKLLARANSPV